MNRQALVCVLLLGLIGGAHAHGDESHGDDAAEAGQQPASVQRTEDDRGETDAKAPLADNGAAQQGAAAHAGADAGPVITFAAIIDDLTWSEFPTLHPMIVHVPVTLIPLALVFSLLGLFSTQRIFIWVALAFTAVGLAAGYVAAFPAHPHTSGLSEAAKVTLQKHDFFAYSTLWLTLAALVAAVYCVWKPARPAKVVLGLMLLLSSLSVALTGHYGGTLAYVHGIGAQGQFLSAH